MSPVCTDAFRGQKRTSDALEQEFVSSENQSDPLKKQPALLGADQSLQLWHAVIFQTEHPNFTVVTLCLLRKEQARKKCRLSLFSSRSLTQEFGVEVWPPGYQGSIGHGLFGGQHTGFKIIPESMSPNTPACVGFCFYKPCPLSQLEHMKLFFSQVLLRQIKRSALAELQATVGTKGELWSVPRELASQTGVWRRTITENSEAG